MKNQTPHSKETSNRKYFGKYPKTILFVGLLWASLTVTTLALYGGKYAETPALAQVPKPSDTPDVWKGQRPAARMITLTPRGFEPASIDVQAGKLLLAINNRAGTEEMALELSGGVGDGAGNKQAARILLKKNIRDREATEQIVRVPKEILNWRGIVDLESGRYTLRDTNHPEWTLTINVN
jgi:hypothetical protein